MEVPSDTWLLWKWAQIIDTVKHMTHQKNFPLLRVFFYLLGDLFVVCQIWVRFWHIHDLNHLVDKRRENRHHCLCCCSLGIVQPFEIWYRQREYRELRLRLHYACWFRLQNCESAIRTWCSMASHLTSSNTSLVDMFILLCWRHTFSICLKMLDGFQKDWLAIGLNPAAAWAAGLVGNEELRAIVAEGPIKEVDCPVAVENSEGWDIGTPCWLVVNCLRCAASLCTSFASVRSYSIWVIDGETKLSMYRHTTYLYFCQSLLHALYVFFLTFLHLPLHLYTGMFLLLSLLSQLARSVFNN